MPFRVLELAPRYLAQLFSTGKDSDALRYIVSAGAMAIDYLFDSNSERNAACGLLVLMTFDLVTGVLGAIIQKKAVTSRALFQTLVKVVDYLAVIAVAAVVEATVFNKTNAVPVLLGVLYLMIATEGLSILENVRKCGVRTFPFLERILDGMSESGGGPSKVKSLASDLANNDKQ